MAARIGDGDPVIGEIGDAAHHRIVGRTVDKADDTGGKGEEIEQADHGKQRQQTQDIRLGLRPADRHERGRRGDDDACHQQHQQNAAPPHRLIGGGRVGRRNVVRLGEHEVRRIACRNG
jgi:hypothetical protein